MHAMPQRRATLPTTPLKQHKQPTTQRLPAVARYGCACCLTVVNAAGRHLDLELPAGSSIRDAPPPELGSDWRSWQSRQRKDLRRKRQRPDNRTTGHGPPGIIAFPEPWQDRVQVCWSGVQAKGHSGGKQSFMQSTICLRTMHHCHRAPSQTSFVPPHKTVLGDRY